ncbi:MAG: FimV/HubP family polar landmark protein, partial [Pseudoxanthomonas sp.]
AAARRFGAAAAAVEGAGQAAETANSGEGYVHTYFGEAPAAAATPDPAPSATASPIPPWSAPPVRPTWHTGSAGQTLATATAAPLPVPPSVAPADTSGAGERERLQLAIAYLDLGDTAAARPLLQQVAASADPAARAQAGQLLRELD